MKKTIFIFVIIVIAGGIVALLFYNKTSIEKKARSTVNMTTIPVKIARISYQKLDENLSLVGTTYPIREVSVVSEAQGRVLSVNFNIGTRIGTGSVLAKVDDEMKQAAFTNAEANYQKTKKDFERYQELNKQKSANDVQLEQATVAYKTAESQYIITKRQLEDTKIKAPFGGIITSKSIEVGTVLSPGMPLANIVDISSLKIRVNAAEKDVFKMNVGDEVQIRTDVYPEAEFSGRIININSKADESHTYPVEIELKNNQQNPLKAGMFVTVSFQSVKKGESLVMPREALVGSIKNPQVYVIGDNMAKLRNISVGAVYSDIIEILSGLNAGESVVTSGQINLVDNTSVSIVK